MKVNDIPVQSGTAMVTWSPRSQPPFVLQNLVTMVRAVRSYSTSAGVRKARLEGSSIRLRSGSAGHHPLKRIDDDEEHGPIEVSAIFLGQSSPFMVVQFAAKSVVDPKDIRIIETDPSGEVHESSGLTFGEIQNHVYDEIDDDEEERGGWDNKLDFLFSCISVSVGLGSNLVLA